MDILSHTFSGVATASLGIALVSLGRGEKVKYLFLGAFVGAFPDLDAVSMWSKWDVVFNTAQKGHAIYTDSHWYSHHGFFHSLMSGFLLVSIIFFFQKYVFKKNFKVAHYVMLFFLFLGYFAHLLEDMPTPHSMWGGVRLFFPSGEYVGGFGKIWWWNNYDIFLLIVAISVFNLICLQLGFIHENYRKVLAVIGTQLLVAVIFVQINSRVHDYSYQGSTAYYMKYEKESLEEQKRILGPWLYNVMHDLDNKIPLNF